MTPPTKRQTAPPSASQADKFADTARALGCDEDEVAFKEKLRRIAREKPKDQTPAPDDRK